MDISLERLKGIYIFSPNEAETKMMTGITLDSKKNILKAAKQLFARVEPEYIILKMGVRGSFVYDGNSYRMCPSFDVIAKDSTGAGDTFNASLAVKLCQGYKIHSAIKYATAAAGLCVTRKGAQISIPNVKEVQKFIRDNDINLQKRN